MRGPGDIDRRSALKQLGIITAGGIAAGLGVTLSSRRAFAIAPSSFSAAPVNLSSNSGEVKDLTVQPDLDYSWDGLDQPPDRIEFDVAVKIDGGGGSFETVATESTSLSNANLNGSGSYTFSQAYSILSNTSLTEDTFEPANGGKTTTSETTTVAVELTARLYTGSSASPYTDSKSTTYDVTVTNQGATVSAGGNAGTGGSVAGKDQ